VVTRLFGAKLELDIFLAAVSVPTILITVIYSTLNDAFLPIFGEMKSKNPKKADSYFFSHLLLLSILSLVVACILSFLSPSISYLLYARRGEMFVKEVATQMFFMSFSLPLAVIATLLGTYFYTLKQFYRFPFAQLVGSLTNLTLIITLYQHFGIWAIVIAFIVNIFFQLLFIFPRNILSFAYQRINIKPLLIAWIPLIIGSFAFRSDTLIIRSFAASLPTGNIVYVNLISKIFSLATSVMTINVQILLLPHLVEYIQKKEFTKVQQNVRRAKIAAIGITLATVLLLTILSPIVINLLFIGGKFSQIDAQKTIALLPAFILPAIGWGVTSVFFQPLLALKKQLHLAIINIISLAMALFIGIWIKTIVGPILGITYSLSTLFIINILGSQIIWQIEKNKFPKN